MDVGIGENMTKKIVWISDFDVTSSGYANISIPICDKLGKRGYDVKAIGLGYDGREHNFEFSLLPAQSIMEVEAILANLQLLWKPDILIVALDIPYHGTLLNHLKNKGDMKYIGIMPIEGDPLCVSHAMILMQMDKALIISEFGTKEAEKVGVTAEHLQIGIDTDSWRIPTPQEKSDLRKAFGIDDSTFVVLTVAENQERKNLSTGLEIFAEFAKDKDTKYLMVTREHSRAGWILTDLAQELKINDKFTILEKGMPFPQLWSIYAMADVFFLPSKAEGLCNLPTNGIYTSNGVEEIQNIKIGDSVLTHAGRMNEVSDVYVRQYCGDIVNIAPKNYGFKPISVTPEHPILIIRRNDIEDDLWNFVGKPVWVEASSIRDGDFMVFPKPKDLHSLNDVDLLHISNVVSETVVVDGVCHSLGRNQYGMEYPHPRCYLRDDVDINKNFMRLLGYYISEGCYTKDGLNFSFHSNETSLHSEVDTDLSLVFGLSSRHVEKDRHRFSVLAQGNGTVLAAKFISNLCGSSSHVKKIPDFVWGIKSEPLLWELLRSVFLGDGTFSSDGQRVLRYSTVSYELALDIQMLLMRLGIVSSFRSAKSRTEYTIAVYETELQNIPFITSFCPNFSAETTKKKNNNYISTDDYLAIPVKTLTTIYRGDVYNLEVEFDHSYCTTVGAIHNCMPILEAFACGVPVVGTRCTAIGELLGENGERGYPVEWIYSYRDPFGNQNRYFIDDEAGAEALEMVQLVPETRQFVIDEARKFVLARTWKHTVDIMENAIKSVTGDENVEKKNE